MEKNNRVRALCRGALIAALYTALTALSGLFGLASMPVQLRLSEALCVLPLFMPEAVVGLTVGCLLSNLLLGSLWQDIVFGTLATLIGALGTYAMRRLSGRARLAAILPPVLSNAAVIPFVLREAYGIGQGWLLLAAFVALGELASVGCLGGWLLMAAEKRKKKGGGAHDLR